MSPALLTFMFGQKGTLAFPKSKLPIFILAKLDLNNLTRRETRGILTFAFTD